MVVNSNSDTLIYKWNITTVNYNLYKLCFKIFTEICVYTLIILFLNKYSLHTFLFIHKYYIATYHYSKYINLQANKQNLNIEKKTQLKKNCEEKNI